MATIPEALAIALQHHQGGRLQDAEQIYRQILAVEPNQAEAWHLLGLIAHQMGRQEVAIEYMEQAIRLQGNVALYYNNLGNALKAQGKLNEAVASYSRALEMMPDFADAHKNLGNTFAEQSKLNEAIMCFRQALKLKPDFTEVYNNLAVAFQVMGEIDESIACCRQALALKPDFVEALYNLGNALKAQEKLSEADTYYRRVLELKPDLAEAHNSLGVVLKEQGKLDEAVTCSRRALELKPDFADAHSDLGIALRNLGQLDEAVLCYRRALELKPNFAFAHNNLGVALVSQGKLDEAVACYCRALELNPNYADAHNNLGSVYSSQGKLDEAIASYRQALEINPNLESANSNLLYSINFHHDYSAKAIYEEHRLWNERLGVPLANGSEPHANERSPGRRLRIGYVSPDFCKHVVGLFMLPLFEEHDHQQFEIFAYSNALHRDEITDRFQSYVNVWHNVAGLSHEALAQQIRADAIDILVDLTMHMSRNRLPVFARKPAPVQVTYLAYCGTTGLTAMDYRITDPYLDPPDHGDSIYSETSVHLPETYWCYRPMIATPPICQLPALQAGHITFGCLNNFCKVTAPTLAAWVRLLHALPNARLILLARTGKHLDRIQNYMDMNGISKDRLEFTDLVPTKEYFEIYQRMDVALDPFPYGGGTTTCDAIWMGVPVITLAGKTAVGRGGSSILSNLRLPELVANNVEEYVTIATGLANDLPRLSALRADLRGRMLSSPLMNAPRFARNIEAAYRLMWQRYCGT